MRHNPISPMRECQSGSTLIISLIILIILMLLGVTAINTSDTQYKLAGNLQFEDSAMNNAETAVSTGEAWIAGSVAGVPSYQNAGFTYATSCSDTHDLANPVNIYALNITTPCLTSLFGDPLTMTWDDGNSLTVSGNTNQRFIIELMSINNTLLGSSAGSGGRSSSGCNKVNTYRITARGVSARGATKFVQSYYSVLSC